MENSERDGNTRPPDLPLEKPVYRSGSIEPVRTGHGKTDWFQIGKGVCQGSILSPCLFNLYAEYIMRNAGLEESQAGIKIARRNINNLRYADDTTLMAESEELKSLLMKEHLSDKEICRNSYSFSRYYLVGTESLHRVRLFAMLWTIARQGYSVHWILQARILEWVAIPSSRGSSLPRIKPVPPAAPSLQANSLLLSHQIIPDTILALSKWQMLGMSIGPILILNIRKRIRNLITESTFLNLQKVDYRNLNPHSFAGKKSFNFL